jgi:hypothetical protein
VAAEEKLRNSARRLFAAAHPSAGFPGRGTAAPGWSPAWVRSRDTCGWRLSPAAGAGPGGGAGRGAAAVHHPGPGFWRRLRRAQVFRRAGGLCQSVLRRGRRCGGERSAAGPGRPYALGGLQGAAPGTAGPGVTVCGISRAELLDGMVLGRGLAGR